MAAYLNNLEHLRDEFRRLDILLGMAVAEFRRRRGDDEAAQYRGLYISDREIDDLLGASGGGPDEARAAAEASAAELRAQIDARVEETRAAGSPFLRLPHLCRVFCLTPFETDLLLLALAPEFDLRYQKLYAYLQDDVGRKRPSVELALRLFQGSADDRVQARRVFADHGPLRASLLLSLEEVPGEGQSPMLGRLLKVDERIVEFVAGSDLLDQRLNASLRTTRWVTPEMSPDDLQLPEGARHSLTKIIELAGADTPWKCLLHGPAGAGKKAFAEAACKALGRALLLVELPALAGAERPFHTILRVALREATLYGSVVYLDGWHELLRDEPANGLAVNLVEQEAGVFRGLLFIGSRTAWEPSGEGRDNFLAVELPPPDDRLRRALWEAQLNDGVPVAEGVDVGGLAGAFRFTGGQIRQALARAETGAWLRQGEGYRVTAEDLLAACRAESTRSLGSFARKIKPQRVWGDLVLPKDTLSQLREFCNHVRHRARVYEQWGFAQKLSLGRGLLALFTGSSGTGKTLAAEILAHELGLDLFRVDLSAVVSKYIGETEKNLSRVFDDAQESNSVLFFDEADALFGKRTEVKDAHDRYANIETNYLLQRVEEYEGVIILASNLSKNIDAAFLRRMRFFVEFPFPDEDHRQRIWEGIFPPQAPLGDDVDLGFLARKFKIAGGNIKNVALSAAFSAAGDGGVIRMGHVVLALKREYQKLGKVCEKSEFGDYYQLVR